MTETMTVCGGSARGCVRGSWQLGLCLIIPSFLVSLSCSCFNIQLVMSNNNNSNSRATDPSSFTPFYGQVNAYVNTNVAGGGERGLLSPKSSSFGPLANQKATGLLQPYKYPTHKSIATTDKLPGDINLLKTGVIWGAISLVLSPFILAIVAWLSILEPKKRASALIGTGVSSFIVSLVCLGLVITTQSNLDPFMASNLKTKNLYQSMLSTIDICTGVFGLLFGWSSITIAVGIVLLRRRIAIEKWGQVLASLSESSTNEVAVMVSGWKSYTQPETPDSSSQPFSSDVKVWKEGILYFMLAIIITPMAASLTAWVGIFGPKRKAAAIIGTGATSMLFFAAFLAAYLISGTYLTNPYESYWGSSSLLNYYIKVFLILTIVCVVWGTFSIALGMGLFARRLSIEAHFKKLASSLKSEKQPFFSPDHPYAPPNFYSEPSVTNYSSTSSTTLENSHPEMPDGHHGIPINPDIVIPINPDRAQGIPIN